MIADRRNNFVQAQKQKAARQHPRGQRIEDRDDAPRDGSHKTHYALEIAAGRSGGHPGMQLKGYLSVSPWLEYLDRIPVWVLDENLSASWTAQWIVSKCNALLPQGGDLRIEIVYGQDQAIPSARFGTSAVRHRPRG
jgi:hypothetical protein